MRDTARSSIPIICAVGNVSCPAPMGQATSLLEKRTMRAAASVEPSASFDSFHRSPMMPLVRHSAAPLLSASLAPRSIANDRGGYLGRRDEGSHC